KKQAGEERLATLLDYLGPETIFLLCEPDQLAERAQEYASQVPDGDPFFVSWEVFKENVEKKGVRILGATDTEADLVNFTPHSALPAPHFQGLDAFRPLAERAPEPHVAETQRREFFAQLHRWLRQNYAVHVFCNNDGERQRFEEIWKEYGLAPDGDTQDASPALHVGSLARGFLFEAAKLVVVTDAEIFGHYKVQRPRRLKSPHAQATRSALDIDLSDLEEGDYVVHLQHGVGRYLGLQVLPLGTGKRAEAATENLNSSQECLVIEYAPSGLDEAPPKLYVPVTEAHLVSKYVGTGKARPPLNTSGGTRWAKAKEHAERAVRDVAGDLLAIQAARDSQPGHVF